MDPPLPLRGCGDAAGSVAGLGHGGRCWWDRGGEVPLPLPRSRGVTAVGGVDAATTVGGVGDCFSNHGQEQRWYGVTHLETKAGNIDMLQRDTRGDSGGGGEKRAK
jgi:hypothetical protein